VRLKAAAALLQALVSVRVFIVFHDTVHMSFFSAPRMNRRLGQARPASS